MKISFQIILKTSIIILLVSMMQISQAQEKPFKFGFKLAPAISWLSPDAKTYEQGGSTFSFAWGFISDFTLMDHYYLSTGFNMSYFKGKLIYPHEMEIEGSIYGGEMNRTYNLRYIEVPLTLKMKTNELVKNLQFFGLIGVNTGFNIRAKSNDDFSGKSILGSNKNYTEEKVDIKSDIYLMKASLIVGAGTEYVVDESVSIIMGLNFNNGFNNVLKGVNTIDPSIDAKAVPYYFELNLGVIF